MTNTNITASRKSCRARGYITDYKPQKRTTVLLHDAKTVLQEYRQYWPLTIRQIFYRLVSTSAAYPKTEQFYGKLCHHMANARRARIIPFKAIRDDGVTTIHLDHFNDEDHFRRHIRLLGEGYTRNKLASQPLHIEVWCEAAGMLPQLSAVTEEFSIQVYSSSGFDSLTAKKNLADRIANVGKDALVLHLGDYDPSGESIFESASEDVSAFLKADWPGINATFLRVALTAAQVHLHNLPTAPPKVTDTRSRAWAGETCQLEALPPDIIADILRGKIYEALDRKKLQRDQALEDVDRRSIALALPAPGGAE